jgi:TPR repeat protein
MDRDGIGCVADDKTALDWWQRAANLGSPEACNGLAMAQYVLLPFL